MPHTGSKQFGWNQNEVGQNELVIVTHSLMKLPSQSQAKETFIVF